MTITTMTKTRNIWERMRAWQDEPWPHPAFSECSAQYRFLFLGYQAACVALSTILWLTITDLEFGSILAMAIGVVIVLASSWRNYRSNDHLTWGSETIVLLSLAIAGHGAAAVVVAIAWLVCAAAKKPLRWFLLTFNLTHYTAQIAVCAALTSAFAASADPGSGRWLAGALAACTISILVFSPWMNFFLALEGTVTWREARDGIIEECSADLRIALGFSVLLGMVIALGPWWAIAFAVLPSIVAMLIAQRNDGIVEARDLARRDPLTDLFNRSTLFDVLSRAHDRSVGTTETSWVVMCDLDNFKQVNDRLGHDVGDEVLCITARSLEEIVRKSDRCFHYGGEEFLVLLDQVTRAEASTVAERIRAVIEERVGPMGTTISVGVHPIFASSDPLDALTSADSAMYHSKRAGKNRVTFTDDCAELRRVPA